MQKRTIITIDLEFFGTNSEATSMVCGFLSVLNYVFYAKGYRVGVIARREDCGIVCDDLEFSRELMDLTNRTLMEYVALDFSVPKVLEHFSKNGLPQ